MKSRRSILAGTAAFIAKTALSRPAKSETKKRIIVIGAGLAGLTAAKQCLSLGHEVLVLEARSRIGGRVWTSRLWQDLPVDLGATWIHGIKGNPLTKLADQAGLARVSTSYNASVLIGDDQGGLDLDAEAELAAENLDTALNDVAKSEDMTVRDAVERHDVWKQSNVMQRRMMRHVINGRVEQEYGADWSEASAHYIEAADEFGGKDELLPSGYDELIHFLSLNIDIKTQTTVQSINMNRAGRVIVGTSEGVEEADHVIVTVPLGVLQRGSISFGRPLSDDRHNAIHQLGMGLLNKCWLRFEDITWDKTVDWIEWLGPKDGYWAQWVSLGHSLKLPVLLAFHGGQQAREMEKLTDEQMREESHIALRSMFGSSFPSPVATQVTRWSRDPHSFGSYSFNKRGMAENARENLAGTDWDGALVFAGEAASPQYFGTAHGAYLSGITAGRMVAKY